MINKSEYAMSHSDDQVVVQDFRQKAGCGTGCAARRI
jgi:hypothetical protein